MKRKFIPVCLAVIGLVGTALPFVSVSIEGDDATVVAAAKQSLGDEASPNAWAFEGSGGAQPGMILGMLLGVIALVAGVAAATRLGRGVSIALALLGVLWIALVGVAWGQLSREAAAEAYRIATGPGVGFYLMLVGALGAAILGTLGTFKPDENRGAVAQLMSRAA